MKKRIIGIDVARALAVIGMIIVNFKVVFGNQGNDFLVTFTHFFDGKAAATFVVLAGVGLALMSNSAIKTQNQEKLKIARKRIFKRALLLFFLGLSYVSIWPADILHFYGIYMLLTLLFINRSSKQILAGTIALILLYPMLFVFFNYETGWDFSTLTYQDFWTVQGFLRNLFYNGFHPILPWAAFMLFGLWFGKQDLNDEHFLKKSLKFGLLTFVVIQVVSFASIQLFSAGNPTIAKELSPILGTDPMPPMPIYMTNGIAISVVIISACILLAKRFENNWLIDALHKTGQLALTFYVAHVLLGIGILEEIGSLKLGEYSITFSLIYALIFSLLCVLFAMVWLKYKKSGPLEWVMKKLVDW